MIKDEEGMKNIKETVLKEKRIVKEFNSLFNYIKSIENEQEKRMIDSQITRLKNSLKKTNDNLLKNLDEMIIKRSLEGAMRKKIVSKKEAEIKEPEIQAEEPVKVPEKKKKISLIKKFFGLMKFSKKKKMSELDKQILKRLKKEKKKEKKVEEKKKSPYVKLANSFFARFVKSLMKEKKFKTLDRNLVKSNLGFSPITYLSLMIFTTLVSIGVALLAFLFFLFFSISPELPIIMRTEDEFGIRLLKTFWMIIVIPAGTLTFMYFYPYLERKSLEGKIDQELPFATIHMAAISGSMVEPVKIFSIISSTKEYPNLEKEFTKLLNEINVYGYDLVTALKDLALNSPSQKLGELFNGLATTITSGGDLYNFFDKRANSMLFEYRLNKEKRTKTAETFMDIYISVVIAAPMILMLLLMMMKISGFGIGLSTSMITFMVVGGVSAINVVFLIFSQVKQQTSGGI